MLTSADSAAFKPAVSRKPLPSRIRSLFKIEKNKLGSFFRVLLAAGLLAFLLNRIGFSEIRQILHRIEPVFLSILFLLLLLDSTLRARNWGLLLGARNTAPPLPELLFSYLAGGFFGTFIPSSLGTDVSRAFLVAKRNGIGSPDSAMAMVVLNLVNLLALCLLALFSCILLFGSSRASNLAWGLGPIALGYCLLFPLLLRGWRPMGAGIDHPLLGRVVSTLNRFSVALKEYNDRQALLIRSLSISLLNQLIGISAVYCVSLSLRLDVPFIFVAAFVPAISLSRLVPLSIAGLGAEQGIFVLLFAQVGVAPAEAFLMSLLLSLSNLCFVLFGGGLFFLDNCRALWRVR